MKCPKCSLVTFDHLSKCPRCDASFELSRRLTRRRGDSKRRILISGASSPAGSAVAAAKVEASTPETPPAAVEGTLSLREMAETEQREDVEVHVADAVTAARAATQAPEEQPVAPVTPFAPEPPSEPTDAAASDSLSLKERMMRASRARRKERPDLVTESADPMLPDWFEPDLDEPDGATGAKRKSAGRR